MNKAIALLLAFSVLTATGAMIVKAASSEGVTENSWETLASMPSAGGYEAAVVNGKIYVFGNSVNYEYDPAANTWAVKTPMPTNRTSFAVAACQGKIYVIGGNIIDDLAVGLNEVYDPVTDSWTTKESMPTPRYQMEANAVGSKIYVMSGMTGGAGSTVDVTEVYDPITDSWTTKASIPYPVVSYASAVVDSSIYVIGGDDNLYWHFNQIYDTESDTWTFGASIPEATRRAAAAATTGVLAPKRIYVVGGEAGFFAPSTQHYIYDIQMNIWSSGASLLIPRFNPAIAVVDDLVYVMGGSTGSGDGWPFATAAVERYTPFLLGSVPEVFVSSPENRVYAVSKVLLNFTVNEQAAWLGYSLDGQNNVTVSGNATVSDLSEGVHSLVVYAEDIAGDVGASETITFTVDAFPLNIAVLSPEAKSYGEADVPLIFTVDEATSRITYSSDGQENVTISGNVTLSGLSGGAHNVTIYAEDEEGNVGASETVIFTVAEEIFPQSSVAAIVVLVSAVAVVAGLIIYFTKFKKRRPA